MSQRLQVVHVSPDENPVRDLLELPAPPPVEAPPPFEVPLSRGELAVEEGLASAALAGGDFAAAIRHCSKLVQSQPAHFQAWINLGVARFQVGETEAAIFCFHQAHRLKPDDPMPWVNLGIVRQRLNENDAAEEAYRKVLERDPRNRVALWNLALLLESGNDWEEIESLLLQLVESHPEHHDAWFRLGLASYRREDLDGCVDAFQGYLERRPNAGEALVNLGVVLYRLGRIEDARSRFEQAMRSNPQPVEALRGLAAVCLELGDSDRALPLRRRLVELRQPMPELTYNLACAMDRMNYPEEAISLYCEALKENPRCAEALHNLGHVLQREGRTTEAAECWKRAATLDSTLAPAEALPLETGSPSGEGAPPTRQETPKLSDGKRKAVRRTSSADAPETPTPQP